MEPHIVNCSTLSTMLISTTFEPNLFIIYTCYGVLGSYVHDATVAEDHLLPASQLSPYTEFPSTKNL